MGYIKYNYPWMSSDQLTGAAFNWIETQWDEAKADADAHNHDARYYTKTLSDATFFTTSFYIGFDADKLDGNHFSDLVAAVMPLGCIMIWSGTDANVPTNWHICDGGTYGGYATPDLRDRFVVGAGSAYAVNDTGGPASWNGTITPTGSVTIGDHALTTAELPTHAHTFIEYSGVWAGDGYFYSIDYYDTPDDSYTSVGRTTDVMVTGDGTHTHAGSTASFAAIDPRPAFHGLYYIMKYA